MSLLRPLGNSMFADTFFANAAANSTHARTRPIVVMLGPVYHQPGVLIDTDDPFSFPIGALSPLSPPDCTAPNGVRVIRARTDNRVIRSNEHRAIRTRKRIARSLRADVLRSSFGLSSSVLILPWRIPRTSTRIGGGNACETQLSRHTSHIFCCDCTR